jgi:hypothetical protein
LTIKIAIAICSLQSKKFSLCSVTSETANRPIQHL